MHLWAKLEGNNPTGSTKDRIALAMVEAAEASGELTPERTILEPTSGNTGISLAMVARRKGYRLTVVLPDNASQERLGLLPAVRRRDRVLRRRQRDERLDRGGSGARRGPRLLHAVPVREPANPKAHEEGTAREILADLPRRHALRRGHGHRRHADGRRPRAARGTNPTIQVVAAEPELGDLVYGLRSLDEGFVPPIFDPAEVNRKFLVNSDDAVRATRALTRARGSSRASRRARWSTWPSASRAELDEGDVVCLLADGGWKYLSTEAWAEDLATAEKQVSESLWW